MGTDESFEQLLIEAKAGNADSMDQLGVMYMSGKVNNTNNFAEALWWFQQAANLGYVESILSIGFIYLNGRGVQKNFGEAVKWFSKAADEYHSSKAMHILGELYHKWDYDHKDYRKAYEWYKKGADHGNSWCMLGIGYLCAAQRNDEGEFEWYMKGAEQGNSYGMNLIGSMYEEGAWVKKDIEKAIYWYKKATELGEPNAKIALERLSE